MPFINKHWNKILFLEANICPVNSPYYVTTRSNAKLLREGTNVVHHEKSLNQKIWFIKLKLNK